MTKKNKKVPFGEFLESHGIEQTKMQALYEEHAEEWLRATVLQYLEASHIKSGTSAPFAITDSQLDTAVRMLRAHGDITALFTEEEGA